MKTKVCLSCKKEKLLSEFYFRKDNHKYRNNCKRCHKKIEKIYYNKNKKNILKINKKYRIKNKNIILLKAKEYYKKFPWKWTLYHIKERCNNKNCKAYKNYGGRGIKCLITAEEIKILWFRDKASKMKIPSIDRIDNDGNYYIENCRFIEKGENSARNKRKPVLQFDLQGNFIREWKSAMEIKRKLNYNNSNISANCLNKRKSAYRFIWKYKEGSNQNV